MIILSSSVIFKWRKKSLMLAYGGKVEVKIVELRHRHKVSLDIKHDEAIETQDEAVDDKDSLF